MVICHCLPLDDALRTNPKFKIYSKLLVCPLGIDHGSLDYMAANNGDTKQGMKEKSGKTIERKC